MVSLLPPAQPRALLQEKDSIAQKPAWTPEGHSAHAPNTRSSNEATVKDSHRFISVPHFLTHWCSFEDYRRYHITYILAQYCRIKITYVLYICLLYELNLQADLSTYKSVKHGGKDSLKWLEIFFIIQKNPCPYTFKKSRLVLQSTGINNKIQLNLYNKTVLFVTFTPLNENSDLETVICGPHPLFIQYL